MIKKWQIGDQIQDHNIGALRYHPRASRVGICGQTQTTGDRALTGLRRLSHSDRDKVGFTQFPGYSDSFATPLSSQRKTLNQSEKS